MELELPVDLHSDRTRALSTSRKRHPLLVFATAAITIVPLSKIVGSATETLGAYLGPTLGGLLNASMGNAPELIIGIFALKNGLIDGRQGLAHRLDHRQLAAHPGRGDVRRRFALSQPEVQRGVGPAFHVDDVPGGCRADDPGALPFHVAVRLTRDQPPDRGDLAGRLCLEPGLYALHSPQVV